MYDSTPIYRPEPRNGLGVSALILGIIGCLFGLVPLTFFIAGPLGVTALILGFSGRGRVKRGRADNPKTSWAGIPTSLVALALSVVGANIVFGAADQLDQDLQEIDRQLEEDLAELDVEMGQ